LRHFENNTEWKLRLIIVFILALFSILPFIFYENNLIIDTNLDHHINPIDQLIRLSYMQDDRTDFSKLNGGIGLIPPILVFSLLELLNISPIVAERIFFSSLLFFSGISMYYLSAVMFTGSSTIQKMISALLFMFNPYVMLNFHSSSFFLIPYSLMPLIIALYIQGIHNNFKLTYCIYTGLLFSLIAGINFTFAAIILVILLYYSIFFIFANKLKSKNMFNIIKFNLSFAVITILLMSAYLIPFIYSVISSESLWQNVIAETPAMYNQKSSFLEVFRLLGEWGFYSGYNGIPYYNYAPMYISRNSNHFITNILIIFNYLIPIIALSGFLFRKNKHLFFLATLLIFEIAMAVGAYPTQNPGFTGIIYMWAYENIPLFQMFRNSYKSVSVIALIYSLLFGFSICKFYGVLKYRWGAFEKYCRNSIKFGMVVLIFVLILFNVYPMVSGGLFEEKSFVSVPDYWYQAANWINEENNDYRIFSLPNQYFPVYTWGHTKNDITVPLISKSQIFTMPGYGGSVYSHNYFKLLYNNSLYEDKKNIYWKLLTLANVKYIVQRNDVDWRFYNVESPSEVKEFLGDQEKIQYLKTFGQVDIYQNTEWNQLYVYTTSNQKIIPTFNDFLSTIESDSFIPAQQNIIILEQNSNKKITEINSSIRPHIYFQKINPTKYKIKIENASEPFYLTFSVAFDPTWKAYINTDKIQCIAITTDQNINVTECQQEHKFIELTDLTRILGESIPEDKHYVVNGYANGWFIDPQELGTGENFVLTLYFKPQSYLYVGFILSATTLIMCLIYLLWDWRKSQHHHNLK